MKIEKGIQEKIQEHLNQGREKLAWLENQINDEKNHQKLQFELEEAKKKIAGLKKTYTEFEEKAVNYTEKNPKKALAIATVAGILAASLWNAFQKKKNSPPPKPARKTKKKAVKPASKAKKQSAAVKN
jgi:ElaB/YqjD/DUF883 family membrane-anchored ribosome-binding protein